MVLWSEREWGWVFQDPWDTFVQLQDHISSYCCISFAYLNMENVKQTWASPIKIDHSPLVMKTKIVGRHMRNEMHHATLQQYLYQLKRQSSKVVNAFILSQKWVEDLNFYWNQQNTVESKTFNLQQIHFALLNFLTIFYLYWITFFRRLLSFSLFPCGRVITKSKVASLLADDEFLILQSRAVDRSEEEEKRWKHEKLCSD